MTFDVSELAFASASAAWRRAGEWRWQRLS
jgi:hypothetical protein